MDGNFTGGSVVYTLKDGGVDLAPYHEFDSAVSSELKGEIDALKAIIDGSVTVNDVLGLWL
jgi:basic membrane protein A